MDVRSALKSQYHAAHKTLRAAIENCPDSMWNDPADGSPPFWRVAYHTLFWSHFYLQQRQEDFVPWARHRDEAQFIASLPWDNNRAPKPCEPFTRGDLLDYLGECDRMIDAAVDALDLSAPESGFPWYNMPKLEHQILNIRHIQHHAAILSNRLRRSIGVAVDWVASR
jgi:DinB superfamily